MESSSKVDLWFPYKVYPPIAVKTKVLYFCVDASGEGIAAVRLINERKEYQIKSIGNSSEEYIAVKELRAILLAVEWGLEILGVNMWSDVLMVIGNDSMTAKGWIDSECSSRSDVTELLCKLFTSLDREEVIVRIETMYINTLINCADEPSRNIDITELNSDRVEKSWEQLQVAEVLARRSWGQRMMEENGSRR
jgi:hypothetical protein